MCRRQCRPDVKQMASVFPDDGVSFVGILHQHESLFGSQNARTVASFKARFVFFSKDYTKSRYSISRRHKLQPVAYLRFQKYHLPLMHKQEHTHVCAKWDKGISHQHSVNYAVKFYPDALVIPPSGEAAESLGTRSDSLKWAKEDGRRPWWRQGKTTSLLSWGASIQDLVFSLLSFPFSNGLKENKTETLVSFWKHNDSGFQLNKK